MQQITAYDFNINLKNQVHSRKPKKQRTYIDIKLLNKLLANDVVREIKMLGDNKTRFTLKKDPKSKN